MNTNILRRLCAETAANVGIVLALSAVPVIICAGAAIDYIHAYHQRTELQARVDGAVLSAVSDTAVENSKGSRKATAEKVFKENCSDNDCKAKIDVSVNGLTVTGHAAYDVPTAFMRIVGINSIPISAEAAAATLNNAYYDIYFAIDISDSMGIGATVADQQKMQASFSCVFACHVVAYDTEGAKGTNGPGVDTTLEKARAIGAAIRLDAAKDAARLAVDDIETAGKKDLVRFGVYTFHNRAIERMPLTNDYTKVRDSLSKIQLGDELPIAYAVNQPGNTAPDEMFDLLKKKITKPGDGTQKNPYKIVVYLSDGTIANRYPKESFTVEAIDPKPCDLLRRKGAEIAVVHVDYNFAGPAGDWAFVVKFKPIMDQIEPSMRACADAGMYYKTADPDEIDQAFKDIAGKVTQSNPHLTQ